jgi:hypothetical protein
MWIDQDMVVSVISMMAESKGPFTKQECLVKTMDLFGSSDWASDMDEVHGIAAEAWASVAMALAFDDSFLNREN